MLVDKGFFSKSMLMIRFNGGDFMSYMYYYSQPAHINSRYLSVLSDYDQLVDQYVKYEQHADVIKTSLRSDIRYIKSYFRVKKNIKLENTWIILGCTPKYFCIVLSHSEDTYFFSKTKELVEEHFGFTYEAHEIDLVDPDLIKDVHIH